MVATAAALSSKTHMSADISIRKVALLHMGPEHLDGSMHQHEYSELIYIVDGEYEVECDGERLSGTSGDVFYFPAGLPHKPAFLNDGFMQLYVVQWDEENPHADRPRHVKDTAGRLMVAVEWLWECYQAEDDAEAHLAAAGLLKATLHQMRQYLTWEDNDLVRRLRHKLLQSLAHPFTLDLMAMIAGYSKFHFVRLFRELTGTTPMKYLQQLRVDKAIDLVERTDLPLQEIAEQVGFAQADSLSRLIRKQTGKAPSAMRKELRNNTTSYHRPLALEQVVGS